MSCCCVRVWYVWRSLGTWKWWTTGWLDNAPYGTFLTQYVSFLPSLLLQSCSGHCPNRDIACLYTSWIYTACLARSGFRAAIPLLKVIKGSWLDTNQHLSHRQRDYVLCNIKYSDITTRFAVTCIVHISFHNRRIVCDCEATSLWTANKVHVIPVPSWFTMYTCRTRQPVHYLTGANSM